MVSGTTWPGGDRFLQRKNEPSMAVSSVNPNHLFAMSNDYGTVDIPGIIGGVDKTGDSWLGVACSALCAFARVRSFGEKL